MTQIMKTFPSNDCRASGQASLLAREDLMELAVTQESKFKIIKVAGRVDWENARLLDKEVHQIVDDGFYHIVFDLNEVTFICSGGVGALVYNLNKVKKSDGAIYIISSNEYVNYIFETLKFDIVFDGYLFDSYEKFKHQILERQGQTQP
ncbi:MAG: STAS domain-containing protein [Chitinivibrionales bacterium]|nr:STAS domain-containing protein [Chitinivibrionales bacterium]